MLTVLHTLCVTQPSSPLYLMLAHQGRLLNKSRRYLENRKGVSPTTECDVDVRSLYVFPLAAGVASVRRGRYRLRTFSFTQNALQLENPSQAGHRPS
jgi:N-formylglutamate amidohydrolase